MQSREPGKAQTLDPGISPDTILEPLNRILSHPEFQATPQQRDILRFVVTETLQGREHQIKGYTVATQVLGRKPDFDPKSDPAVSVLANRLRKALERYSLVAGSHDSIRIEIPKGTYVPVFHVQETPGLDEPPGQWNSDASAERDPWPTVLVRPFRNLTGDPEQVYVSAGLASPLAIELSRYQDIRVWMHGLGGRRENASDSAARMVIAHAKNFFPFTSLSFFSGIV